MSETSASILEYVRHIDQKDEALRLRGANGSLLYTHPTSGFLSVLPPSWVPFAQLMRLEKPAGFYAFYILSGWLGGRSMSE